MVFLQKIGVKEAQAMILTTPAGDGVLLRQAQSRDRLAGVEQDRCGVGNQRGVVGRAGSG